jgi:regulatory protein
VEEHPESHLKKKLTPEAALAQTRHYCAYQERSHREVKKKLLALGLPHPKAEEIVSQLIIEGFINEERFARAFAGGKFRMKKWGRLKIERELKSHGLTARCIALGLKEIEGGDYHKTLASLLKKKSGEYHDLHPLIRKKKLAAYALAKGFEPDLIWALLEAGAET